LNVKKKSLYLYQEIENGRCCSRKGGVNKYGKGGGRVETCVETRPSRMKRTQPSLGKEEKKSKEKGEDRTRKGGSIFKKKRTARDLISTFKNNKKRRVDLSIPSRKGGKKRRSQERKIT